jgi:hypothetical protein
MSERHADTDAHPGDAVLLELGRRLREHRRQFTTPTPVGKLQPCPSCGSESVAEIWTSWIYPGLPTFEARDPTFVAREASGEVRWDPAACEVRFPRVDLVCNACDHEFLAAPRP